MKDSYGRDINYLRISVTDRCNLRCSYCMPRCGAPDIPHGEILTYEEIARIAEVSAKLGVNKVRLTGGEPLVRKGITELVRMIRGIPGIEELNMTTNGILLAKYAAQLKESGIDRINISLDSMDRDVFKKITGTDGLDDVLRGIDTAQSLGIPVKINCVPINGINNNDIMNIAVLARDKGIDVRYIELMPIGCGTGFSGIPTDELIELFKKKYGRALRTDRGKNSPADDHIYTGFKGKIGYISPISHKFCDSCNRIRLTSDGFLKLCLQYDTGVDLKKYMREGISDTGLEELMREAVMNKPREHRFPVYPANNSGSESGNTGSESDNSGAVSSNTSAVSGNSGALSSNSGDVLGKNDNIDKRMMYHIGG